LPTALKHHPSAGFVQPMLASPLLDKDKRIVKHLDLASGLWVAEQKFDGVRVCVDVKSKGGNLFGDPSAVAHTRYGLPRILPPHVRQSLERFPSGIFDGELYAPGLRSYGSDPRGENSGKLILAIFDVTELVGRDLVDPVFTYDARRAALSEIFHDVESKNLILKTSDGVPAVQLARSYPLTTLEHVYELRDEIWEAGGEGLILKRRTGIYRPDKRVKDWIKVKDCQSAVLTLIGFRDSLMGPHSVVLLRDDEGNETSVKTKNHDALRYFDQHTLIDDDDTCTHRPTCYGRQVRIEFQERTPDRGYRHPRWDRWENQ
jgi:ATP-dependent DNA ligase